ncbi:hypothetical protein ABPG77_003032 [Micractinium sp. CCAP 211/92]
MQEAGQPYGDDRQGRRPVLQSVVAPVEGEPNGSYDQGGRRKRSAGGELLDDKPDVKRRNQRLFGAILGTLQRFSREEEQTRSTAAAQRRAELEQRAEQKKIEAVAEAKRQAREEMRQLREGEMARRREMRIQAACGRLEALYAGRMARMDKLASHFLRTATGPSLYWRPGKPCRELAPLEEQQRQEHEAEKERLRQQMEQEKEQLVAQMSQRRPQQWGGPERGQPGPAGGQQEGEEAMEADEPQKQQEEQEEAEHAAAAHEQEGGGGEEAGAEADVTAEGGEEQMDVAPAEPQPAGDAGDDEALPLDLDA